MDFDEAKVDDAVLALMYLTLHDGVGGTRAWKGFDWDTLARLHQKGLIGNPRSKAKSVVLTDAGLQACEALFKRQSGVTVQQAFAADEGRRRSGPPGTRRSV